MNVLLVQLSPDPGDEEIGILLKNPDRARATTASFSKNALSRFGKCSTIRNNGHVQGGCMVPVNLLAEHKVNVLIVGGIGMRPLMGFRQVGISVYHEAMREEIKPVVEDLIAGRLQEIQNEQVCGGGA